MTRGLFWGGLAVGLGLGVALGYSWAWQARPALPEPAPVATSAPASPAIVTAVPPASPTAPDEAHLEPPARPAAAEARARPHPELSAPQIAELKARVADLSKELAHARDQLVAQTAPLSPPAALPERFSQKAIIAAVTSALREVHSSAQLSSVDCTEYPCIAYFQSLTDTDLQALKQSTAYQTYGHDRFMTLGRAGADGPYDGLVVWPANDTNPRDAVRARLRFRLGQMLPE